MQVLLNTDVKNLGYRGDIINVKRGYFRNFLYPKGIAVAATPNLIELSEKRNEKRLMQKQQIVENAKDVLKKLKGLIISITTKASDKGKLYGSITENEIIEEIKKEKNLELEKEFIVMDHLKEVGDHKIKIHLGEGLEEEIVVKIEAA